MRKFALATLVLVASFGIASPVSAASSVTVDFPDGALFGDCIDSTQGVPVNLTVVGPATATRYEATVALKPPVDAFPDDPGVTFDDSFIQKTTVSGSVPVGGGTRNKTAIAPLCIFDFPGVWTADVVVKFYDSDDTLVDTASGSDTAALRWPLSTVTLTRGGEGRTFLAHSTVETPTGFEVCKHCSVVIQKRASGRWKRILEGTTNRAGDFATKLTPKPGVYRAKMPAFGLSSSVSAPFRVR